MSTRPRAPFFSRWARPPLVALLVLGAFPGSPAQAQITPVGLAAEIDQQKAILDAVPASPLGQAENPRLQAQLAEAAMLLKSAHPSAALEMLSTAVPAIAGLGSASTGWEDSGKVGGKGMDALTREWEEVGRVLTADRPKFPVHPPAGQSAFVRALAEQSIGQIDEQYAVAVDYGRVSGASAGAYYLGRAQGHLALALFLSGLPSDTTKRPLTLPSLAAAVNELDDDIVAAYAKPGSTKEHTNFIIANSSLKLARELDRKGWGLGALLTMMRGRMFLALATLPAPGPEQDGRLSASLDACEKDLRASKVDQSIGTALAEKARLALEKSRTGGEGGDRERLRAAALVSEVLPRYLAIAKVDDLEEGSKK